MDWLTSHINCIIRFRSTKNAQLNSFRKQRAQIHLEKETCFSDIVFTEFEPVWTKFKFDLADLDLKWPSLILFFMSCLVHTPVTYRFIFSKLEPVRSDLCKSHNELL